MLAAGGFWLISSEFHSAQGKCLTQDEAPTLWWQPESNNWSVLKYKGPASLPQFGITPKDNLSSIPHFRISRGCCCSSVYFNFFLCPALLLSLSHAWFPRAFPSKPAQSPQTLFPGTLSVNIIVKWE